MAEPEGLLLPKAAACCTRSPCRVSIESLNRGTALEICRALELIFHREKQTKNKPAQDGRDRNLIPASAALRGLFLYFQYLFSVFFEKALFSIFDKALWGSGSGSPARTARRYVRLCATVVQAVVTRTCR